MALLRTLRYTGCMRGGELRRIREGLGFTQAEFEVNLVTPGRKGVGSG